MNEEPFVAPLRPKSIGSECLSFASALSDDLLYICANFVISSLVELSIFGSVSRGILTSLRALSADRNAPVWEVIFQNLDPILHGDIKQHNIDTPGNIPKRSWYARLLDLRRLLQGDAAAEASPRILCSGCGGMPLTSSATLGKREVEVVDVVLYNHPTQGFMINLGEVQRSACVYGLRIARGDLPPPSWQTVDIASIRMSLSKSSQTCFSANSTETKLSKFLLPKYVPGAPAPLSLTTSNVLLLVSLNGKVMSEFSNFDEVVHDIKIASEFCRWRFLFYPSSEIYRAPSECTFGGLKHASHLSADWAENWDALLQVTKVISLFHNYWLRWSHAVIFPLSLVLVYSIFAFYNSPSTQTRNSTNTSMCKVQIPVLRQRAQLNIEPRLERFNSNEHATSPHLSTHLSPLSFVTVTTSSSIYVFRQNSCCSCALCFQNKSIKFLVWFCAEFSGTTTTRLVRQAILFQPNST